MPIPRPIVNIVSIAAFGDGLPDPVMCPVCKTVINNPACDGCGRAMQAGDASGCWRIEFVKCDGCGAAPGYITGNGQRFAQEAGDRCRACSGLFVYKGLYFGHGHPNCVRRG